MFGSALVSLKIIKILRHCISADLINIMPSINCKIKLTCYDLVYCSNLTKTHSTTVLPPTHNERESCSPAGEIRLCRDKRKILDVLWKPLAPPKNDPFTLDQLKEFDGKDTSKPVYVSIKGTVFDVSSKRDTYGPGGSYALLAGKDGSVGTPCLGVSLFLCSYCFDYAALGKSSLKLEDAIPDYSKLEPSEKKALDQWHDFFSKVGYTNLFAAWIESYTWGIEIQCDWKSD